MNATATLPPEVAHYLDRVRAALADLPAEERDELLGDLEVSLLEGSADSVEPPEARLGPPERFAQELRAAAGIEPAAPAAPATASLGDRLRALADGPRARAAAGTARELAPAWWVARGYVAACALALVSGLNWSSSSPLLPVRDAPAFGLLLVVAGVAASVWVGLRARRGGFRGRRWTALNVALAVVALPVAFHALNGPEPRVIEVGYAAPAPEFGDGLRFHGEAVRNIYPYSRDGKLLLDVLLYDDQGRALEVGSQDPHLDPLRRYLLTASGERLLNGFPIRYVEPGTSKVAAPTAAPEGVRIPKIETPPLKVKRP